MNEGMTYQVRPIGRVRRNGNGQGIEIEIDEAYRPALLSLDHFTHVVVLWWADRLDGDEYRTMLQSRPPYAEEHLTGVFATRAPYRPNPIAMTTCRAGRRAFARRLAPRNRLPVRRGPSTASIRPGRVGPAAARCGL